MYKLHDKNLPGKPDIVLPGILAEKSEDKFFHDNPIEENFSCECYKLKVKSYTFIKFKIEDIPCLVGSFLSLDKAETAKFISNSTKFGTTGDSNMIGILSGLFSLKKMTNFLYCDYNKITIPDYYHQYFINYHGRKKYHYL